MNLRRRRRAFQARALFLAITVAALLFPSLAAPADTRAVAPALAPRAGEGNHVVLGTRESGLWLEVTVTGMELGGVSYEGYGNHSSSGFLTSRTVTVQGTAYNALGNTNLTRPSMRATLGTNSDCDNVQKQTWPPPDMLDVNGLVGGPYEAEMPFSYSYEAQPGIDRVCFVVQTGMNGGQYEGVKITGIGWVGEDFWATAGPPAVPTVPEGSPAGGKPPCDYPLFFYPGQDFGDWYTDQPSLTTTQEGLVNDLLQGYLRYAATEGNKIVDGARDMDPKEIAETFTSDSTLPEGKALAPALQQAAGALARERQVESPSYRISPGELLELSLKLNKGNVRNALITCHAATYRDAAGVNKEFVEKQGILKPLRNAAGYADTTVTFTTPQGSTREINPRKQFGSEEQGAWYHLYGTTALEFTDRYGAAAYYAAIRQIAKSGNAAWTDALAKVQDKGMPVTGLGGLLGDLSVALEEAIRSRGGQPPDVDKNCLNYWGLKAGHDLKALVQNPQTSAPPADSYTPGGQFVDAPSYVPMGHGKESVARSPLSVYVEGINGEWFSFDQVTKQFDGNTPYVLFDYFPEEDGTWGLVTQPLFEVNSIVMTATDSGPAQVATYDPATRRAEAYELTVQPGDQLYIPGGDGLAQLNGILLMPASSTKIRRPFPRGPVAAGAGLLMAALGAVLLGRRSRRRRHAARPPAPVPVDRPPAVALAGQLGCPACGAPLMPGRKFCGNCGARVPETPPLCPHCGQPVSPGARFCGTCGQAQN